MKFRSRDENVRRITDPSGHVAIVGPVWRELPEFLHNVALAAGCISSDQAKTFGVQAAKNSAAKSDVVLSLEEVKNAMKEILSSNDEANFTTSGLPNKAALNKLCGGRVAAELYDQAFAELQKESEVAVVPASDGNDQTIGQ